MLVGLFLPMHAEAMEWERVLGVSDLDLTLYLSYILPKEHFPTHTHIGGCI